VLQLCDADRKPLYLNIYSLAGTIKLRNTSHQIINRYNRQVLGEGDSLLGYYALVNLEAGGHFTGSC